MFWTTTLDSGVNSCSIHVFHLCTGGQSACEVCVNVQLSTLATRQLWRWLNLWGQWPEFQGFQWGQIGQDFVFCVLVSVYSKISILRHHPMTFQLISIKRNQYINADTFYPTLADGLWGCMLSNVFFCSPHTMFTCMQPKPTHICLVKTTLTADWWQTVKNLSHGYRLCIPMWVSVCRDFWLSLSESYRNCRLQRPQVRCQKGVFSTKTNVSSCLCKTCLGTALLVLNSCWILKAVLDQRLCLCQKNQWMLF